MAKIRLEVEEGHIVVPLPADIVDGLQIAEGDQFDVIMLNGELRFRKVETSQPKD